MHLIENGLLTKLWIMPSFETFYTKLGLVGTTWTISCCFLYIISCSWSAHLTTFICITLFAWASNASSGIIFSKNISEYAPYEWPGGDFTIKAHGSQRIKRVDIKYPTMSIECWNSIKKIKNCGKKTAE